MCLVLCFKRVCIPWFCVSLVLYMFLIVNLLASFLYTDNSIVVYWLLNEILMLTSNMAYLWLNWVVFTVSSSIWYMHIFYLQHNFLLKINHFTAKYIIPKSSPSFKCLLFKFVVVWPFLEEIESLLLSPNLNWCIFWNI